MKNKIVRGRAGSLTALLAMAAFVLATGGCSRLDNSGESAPPKLNATYYQFLGSSTAIRHSDAQPRVPASGEFFSENTKHFDLVPAGGAATVASLAKTQAAGFALYRPAGPIAATKLAAAGTPEIPGFKNDNFPAECLARTGDDRLVCVDEARRKQHVSYHDVDSLRIQLGGDPTAMIGELVLRSLDAHLRAADRAAVNARLTGFANASPGHAAFSAASYDLFGRAGYVFSHAVVTDGSRGDVNGDGALESHSTLIVELRKTLPYRRQAVPAVDACVAKHASAPFTDEYVANLDAFVHLDPLDATRRKLVFASTPVGTNAQMVEQANAHHEARAINQAQDANLLGYIAANTDAFPWSATEYMVHFQLAPQTVTKYVEVAETARLAGDDACAGILRSHLNPHTAIVTGKAAPAVTAKAAATDVHVFYQVPEPASTLAVGGAAADFCLHDGDGRKIAILDPGTGGIVAACESGSGIPRQKFTEDGACKNDPNHWAYWPSRARTPRFFTAQLILTENLLHDQTADYWSIQWYQNGWKAAGQVVVKGAGFVINTAIRIAAGQLPAVDDFGQEAALRIGVYFVNAFLPTLIDATFKSGGDFTIAGYVVKIPIAVMNFAMTLAKTAVDNPTLIMKLAGFMKGFIIGFAIDRLTSTSMQIVESMLFEWQDYSNGSHPGCFNFNS